LGLSYGVEARQETTLLTEKAARYLARGPADVVDLIGHICNLPAAPRIVAEHMAQAMFAGRPEFVCDSHGRWSIVQLPAIEDRGAGELPVREPVTYPPPRRGRRNARSFAPPQPLASLTWAVVDVETTGGRLYSDRITEVAAVIVENREIKEVYETLVNPLRTIPPMISKITNITYEMVRNAPTMSSVAPVLVEKLAGRVFVAHNANFDWRFVCSEVSRVSGQQLSGQRLCTVRLAKRLLPQLNRKSLDYVADYYGIENHARHRAGGDALATAKCLIHMLDDAADRGCETWDDLDKLLRHRASKQKKKKSAFPTSITRDTTA
jgi:DNA polymerase-3 subunit epsilon